MRVKFIGTDDGPQKINFMGCIPFEKGKVTVIDEDNPDLRVALGKLNGHSSFKVLGASSAYDESGEPGDEDDGDGEPEDERPLPSAAVITFMAENDIDEDDVSGTGKNGRITKRDVEQYRIDAIAAANA